MTVRDVRERLPRKKELPYTTVLGLLQVMEREGLVAHEVENQTHRYRPLLSRRQGTSRLLTDFVQRFFCGAAEKLVLGLVDACQLSPEDLRDLESRLAADGPRTDADDAVSVARTKQPKPKRRKR